MPDNEFNIDLRDIRFNLYEVLPFEQLRTFKGQEDLDQQSVDQVLDECFKFMRDVFAPLNRSGDQEGCHFDQGKVTTPKGHKEAYSSYCDNGWIAVSSAVEHGGLGLPHSVGVATGEMYIGSNCALALSPGLTRSAANLLAEHGDEELKYRYLPKLMSGEWQGTMCLTEPQAGSAVGDIKTLARPDGDSWLLEGNKIFITSGDHDLCDNHVHLVLARTPGAPKGFKGISLFLAPKFLLTDDGKPGELNDVVCAGIEHKLGIKGSPTCSLNFGEEGKCRGWLVGEEGKGLNIMFHMMNEARIGVGVQSVALASQAYLYAREYACERVQGVDIEQMRNLEATRVAIAHHPDVRRMLLHAKAIVEGSRALLFQTAFCADVKYYSEDEARVDESNALLEILTPMCKAWISDQAFEATRLAVQIMGGYGYISEYPVEQHLRDVKIASIYEGTNGIQALDLLGRKLGAKQGHYYRTLLGRMQGFAETQRDHLGLIDDIAVFAAELERWSKTTMDLGVMGMSGDQLYPVLSATPYLEMAGNTVVSWLLLEQAVVAHDKLQTLYLDNAALDTEAREQLHSDNAEARFYFNKIATARFFVNQILVKNQTIAAQIGSGDRSALAFVP